MTGPSMPFLLQALAEGSNPASTTDPLSQGIVGVLIVALFVMLAKETAHRVLVAMVCVTVLWIVTYFTPLKLIGFESSAAAIDMNVIMLLGGMMAVVGVLKSTGGFAWAVDLIMTRARGRPRAAVRLIVWFTGITSAFLDNVTTVIFVTPMAMGLAKRVRLRPVVLLLPMVVASNVGGTATLIGDPPNVMIGSGAHLTFLAFIENLTAPVLVMMVVLQWYVSRYYRDDFESSRVAPPETEAGRAELTDPVLFRWMVVICAAILAGFFTHSLTGAPVAVPAVLGAAAALVVQDVRYLRSHAPRAEERSHGILEIISNDIEWPTLCFFAFLFILVGAAVQTGLVASIAQAMGWSIAHVREALGLSDAGTLVFAALLVCWMSAVLSAFIDNIPYVAVSIPVIAHLIPGLQGQTEVLWWALSLGACLGGNATAVGASANVTTIGLAERGGVRIGFREYSRFAAPAATLTILVASLFLVSYVYMGGGRARLSAWLAAALLIGVTMVRSRGSGAALLPHHE
jgi:Na+/H+ antiporter NhaD/arsenite permease-like protein